MNFIKPKPFDIDFIILIRSQFSFSIAFLYSMFETKSSGPMRSELTVLEHSIHIGCLFYVNQTLPALRSQKCEKKKKYDKIIIILLHR